MAPAKPSLVTGGCGFVGQHLVNRLLAERRSVWIIDDLSTGDRPEHWLPQPCEATLVAPGVTQYRLGEQTVVFIHADLTRFLLDRLTNTPSDEALELPPFGDVFHLAAVVGGRSQIEGDPMICAFNTTIDATFFLWCVRNRDKIERLLYASSSAAYPIHLQNAGRVIALEEQLIGFDERLGVPDLTYGWSKLTGEYLCSLAASHYGLHVACIRPFSGYGVGQAQSYPIPALARRIARQDDPVIVWGTGHQARDFVYIDDCISAMFVVLDHVTNGAGVNIGSGKAYSFIEVVELMARLTGYHPQIQPLIDKPMGVETRYADISLLQSFGWQPTVSLADGLTRVLEEQRNALLQERVAESQTALAGRSA